MAKQPVIERFPTLVKFRDRVKKRVEETRARVKKFREGGGGGSKPQLIKEIREKGIAETIRARREKRLAKSRRSPVIEEPKVRVYSETESVIEEPKVKTYTAPIKTY